MVMVGSWHSGPGCELAAPPPPQDCNFIHSLPAPDQKAFRTLVIRLVLATDMKQVGAVAWAVAFW